ncbi:MAG: threonine--tRNA ligase [Planctomycetes bacterium]|nr:threonine--tRNA ligase [Planctomycetota bacterium]
MSSDKVKISLKDGSVKEYPRGVKVEDVVRDIGEGLYKASACVKLGGKFADFGSGIEKDTQLVVLTKKDPEALAVLRHSAAHVLAKAVCELFPNVRLGFGPAREDGFHYDIVSDKALSQDDFDAINNRMAEIVKADLPFVRKVVSADQALAWARASGQKYKIEAIEKLGGADGDEPGSADVSSARGTDVPSVDNHAQDARATNEISLYETGDFVDLCRGPHVRTTALIGCVEVTQVSGSYWLGDEDNDKMQRVRGVAFFSKKDRDDYFNMLEEAKKRDHRRLGVDLDLFHFEDDAPGMPFFHPKGATIYNALLDYSRRLQRKAGYVEVKTPLVLSEELWKRTGHWDNYLENMFFSRRLTAVTIKDGDAMAVVRDEETGYTLAKDASEEDDRRMAVKPMNCPGHVKVFGDKRRSYSELPIRISEFGMVHRRERAGVRHGLLRVQAFTQDDAHIFCTPEQIESEVVGAIKLIQKLYSSFGFEDIHVELSTKPEKSIGSAEVWERAENALAVALKTASLDFKLNPGDGAFYGPKIDFHIRDSIGRSWQCGTVQLDFSMPGPDRLDVSYIGADDKPHVPVMIHRAMYGSVERFLGILIEHYAGEFPVWLAPVQATILPIVSKVNYYAQQVAEKLLDRGVRVTVDERGEKVQRKIREAELQKVPYMLVVGEKEAQLGSVSVRRHGEGDQGVLSVDDFLAQIEKELRV